MSENSTEYTSLLGIPMGNVLQSGNTTFNIEMAYWRLDCPTLQMENDTQLRAIWASNSNTPLTNWGGIDMVNSNSMNFAGPARCESNAPAMPPRTVIFGGYGSLDDPEIFINTFASCSIYTTYVELSVSCNNQKCSVDRLRNSTQPHLQETYTTLDGTCTADTQKPMPAAQWFQSDFARVITDGHPTAASPLMFYFSNPALPFSVADQPPVYTVGNESFAISFAQLLNTYWTASVGIEAITAGDPSSYAPVNASGLVYFNYETVPATITANEQILVCNWGWFAALVIATLVMFVASVVNIVLGTLIVVPELKMNIATVTRDSLYLGQHPGGSTLGDYERSDLLDAVRVRFGDVASEAPVGHLALGNFENVAKFDKTREYF
jgi:hypothetical protein